MSEQEKTVKKATPRDTKIDEVLKRMKDLEYMVAKLLYKGDSFEKALENLEISESDVPHVK